MCTNPTVPTNIKIALADVKQASNIIPYVAHNVHIIKIKHKTVQYLGPEYCPLHWQ